MSFDNSSSNLIELDEEITIITPHIRENKNEFSSGIWKDFENMSSLIRDEGAPELTWANCFAFGNNSVNTCERDLIDLHGDSNFGKDPFEENLHQRDTNDMRVEEAITYETDHNLPAQSGIDERLHEWDDIVASVREESKSSRLSLSSDQLNTGPSRIYYSKYKQNSKISIATTPVFPPYIIDSNTDAFMNSWPRPPPRKISPLPSKNLKKKMREEKKESNSNKTEHLDRSSASIKKSFSSIKSRTRCRFWPNCNHKIAIFSHPSQDCPAGSLCPFVEKCCFIHHPQDDKNLAIWLRNPLCNILN